MIVMSIPILIALLPNATSSEVDSGAVMAITILNLVVTRSRANLSKYTYISFTDIPNSPAKWYLMLLLSKD